jgi:hypothetical protein
MIITFPKDDSLVFSIFDADDCGIRFGIHRPAKDGSVAYFPAISTHVSRFVTVDRAGMSHRRLK